MKAMIRSASSHLTLGESDAPTLMRGRCHEITGAARHGMAAMVAGRCGASVLWLTAKGATARLCPYGLTGLLDPGRLVCARDVAPIEALWAAEEALRAGAVGCVVLETTQPPGLTPVRRLNLAAEAGATVSGALAPLCLVLLAESAAAGAVETRWRADPVPDTAPSGRSGDGSRHWSLSLTRDKAGPPRAWTWDVDAGRATPC
jgi:protein ImuA